MLRAGQMNLKPSINLSLHAGSAGDVLGAGPTGDIRVFFWLEGFRIKASSKSIKRGRLVPGHAPVQVYSYVWELQVLNSVFKILTSTCTCTHLPLRLTNPLRVRKLHFPLLGKAGARAGWYTTHMLVQFNSVEHYLWVFFFNADWELYRALTATCTRAHPPPRPTNPLRVRMLHFPPLGEAGAEAGRHTTMQ